MYINKYYYILNIKNNYLKNKCIQNEKNTCKKFSEHIKKSLKNKTSILNKQSNEIKNFNIIKSDEKYIQNIINDIQKAHISLQNLEKIRDTLISTYHEIMDIEV
jgi:flagellar hook-basal body complex protein FliE